jgi:hypothetical protein
VKECCIHRIAAIFIAAGFQIPDEGDRVDCPTCGAAHQIVNGKWRECPPAATEELD